MSYRRFYLFSLIIIITASVYPIYMGIVTLFSFFKFGAINAQDYQKYIIPYTPLCIALIITTAILPILLKLLKRGILLIISLIGILLFIAAEIAFEQIKVVEGYTTLPLESWQYSLCIATPQVLESIGEPIYAVNNPAYKIHFYIIAIIIILIVLNVIYGFSRMIREKNYSKKNSYIAQTISAVLLISLCILACFTAFYRNGTLRISPISAVLMSVFFIIFGMAAGIFIGSVLYGRSKLLSRIIPAIVASLTTLIMYIGELILMGGELFQYGNSFLFMPIGVIPFSLIDIAIILLTGGTTYIVMYLLSSKRQIPPSGKP